jgi:hypothetical protein
MMNYRESASGDRGDVYPFVYESRNRKVTDGRFDTRNASDFGSRAYEEGNRADRSGRVTKMGDPSP